MTTEEFPRSGWISSTTATGVALKLTDCSDWAAIGAPDENGELVQIAGADPRVADYIANCVNSHEPLIGALRDILGDGPDIVKVDPVGAGTHVKLVKCRHCGRMWAVDGTEPKEYCPSDDCPGYIARAALAEAEKVMELPKGTMSDRALGEMTERRRTLQVEISETRVQRADAYRQFKKTNSNEDHARYTELNDALHRKIMERNQLKKQIADEMRLRHPPGSRTFAKTLRDVLREKGLDDVFKEAQARWDATRV